MIKIKTFLGTRVWPYSVPLVVLILLCCFFYFCSFSYCVYLWSLKVLLALFEATVIVDFVVAAVDDIVVVNVVVVALLVVTAHIILSCGQ